MVQIFLWFKNLIIFCFLLSLNYYGNEFETGNLKFDFCFPLSLNYYGNEYEKKENKNQTGFKIFRPKKKFGTQRNI